MRKSVAKIMKFFATQRRSEDKVNQKSKEVEIVSPTLQILKRNGEYCVMLNSTPNDSNPIVFMLTKSDYARKIARVKKILREKGLNVSCKCEKNFKDCECMSNEVKEKIEFELEGLSKDDEVDVRPSEIALHLVKAKNDDNEEEEVDLTFTPPTWFAVAAAKSHKVNSVSYTATQYDSKDVTPSPPIKATELKSEMANVARSGTKLRNGNVLSKKGSKDDNRM